jgi:hypothetical protein
LQLFYFAIRWLFIGGYLGFIRRLLVQHLHHEGYYFSEGMWFTEAAVMATRTLTKEILENFVPAIPEVQPLPDRADHIKRFTGHYQKAGIS